MFMMRFDMRAPEFGASTTALYADPHVQQAAPQIVSGSQASGEHGGFVTESTDLLATR